MPTNVQRTPATITKFPLLTAGMYALRLIARQQKTQLVFGKVQEKFIFIFNAEQQLVNGQWVPCKEKIQVPGVLTGTSVWIDAPADSVEPNIWKPSLVVSTGRTYGNLDGQLTKLVHHLSGSQERANNWADTTNCDVDGFYDCVGVADIRMDRDYPTIFNFRPSKVWLQDWENRGFMCEQKFLRSGAMPYSQSSDLDSIPDPMFGDDFPDPFGEPMILGNVN